MKALLEDLRIFLTLVFVSLVLILMDSIGILRLPKALLQNLTIPIQYGIYESGKAVGDKFGFIFLARSAFLENKALHKQLDGMLLENSSLRKKLADDETLLNQQKSLNPQTFDLLPARVISLGRLVTLDKGSDDGVKEGQAVVYKDAFLGQVKSVSPKVSQVLLSEDPDSKLAVFSQNSSGKAKGILTGQFGSQLLMDKILHQELIATGDLVYSDGTEGKLPRGLLIGRVSQVYERQNEVFKQAQVGPIFEASDLDVVFVILN